MAGDIRGFALEKVEIISSCLRDLLSSGEDYVVELGLKAEQFPPWLMLFSAVVGLLLMLMVCGALLGGNKKRSVNTTSKGNVEPHKDLTKNNTAPEEVRRKHKKKVTEKTPSNGQPVSILQGFQEHVKVSPKIKVEKVQSTSSEVLSAQIPAHIKKNKKKPKPEARPTQQTSTAEEKQDDGAWETKVSNREKRQQRKKERGPDDSGSPGGLVAPRALVEGTGVKTTKKNKKHGSLLSKSTGKVGVGGAASTWSEEALNNTAGWIDMSLKMSSKRGPMEGPKWSGSSATQSWTQETQAWSGIESRMKNDLNPVSFSMLAQSPAEPAASSIEQWTNQVPEDDWSGFNGITTDPTSDWNAPLEHWGNYEEPSSLEPPAFPLKEQPGVIKLSEDDKDSDPSEGKSKKRRRKKKKTEEESGSASQMVSSVFKQELSAQSSHKPSPLPAQKKPEETAEPLKLVQKKKVRRET